MRRAPFPRTVIVYDLGVVWSGVAGWLAALDQVPPGRAGRCLYRSLTIGDINCCEDKFALDALIERLSNAQTKRAARPPCGVRAALSQERIGALRDAASKRLHRISNSRAYAPSYGRGHHGHLDGASDPLRSLLHDHPELLQLKGLRSELRHREAAQ